MVDAWRSRTELRLESNYKQLGANRERTANSNGWVDSLAATLNRTDIQNIITHGDVLGVSRHSVDERRQSTFGLNYYYEKQQSENSDPDLTRALFAHYGFTRRTTDDLLSPHTGVVANVDVGVGTPVVSTKTFGRLIGQLAWFHALTPRDDFALRGEFGAVFAGSSQDIPQALLFRTGGDTSVRGYAFNSLGVSKDSAIVGGRYYALASTEYTHWFADTWGVAAFVDSGNATDQISGFQFATGYGIGARVKTPIGPLRVDLAYGEKTQEVRIHFSAGLAF